MLGLVDEIKVDGIEKKGTTMREERVERGES